MIALNNNNVKHFILYVCFSELARCYENNNKETPAITPVDGK